MALDSCPAESHNCWSWGYLGNHLMYQQPAANNRHALLAGAVLRICVAASLFLASPSFGAAAKSCHDALAVSRLGSCELCRSAADGRPISFPGMLINHSRPSPANQTLDLRRSSVPPLTNCATDLPILSNGHSMPQTEGLTEEHPPQVRVEPRRWGMVMLASGGKASRCGGPPNRRSACRAPRLALPPLSFQEHYCTWVI
jgi:hypothetical protein